MKTFGHFIHLWEWFLINNNKKSMAISFKLCEHLSYPLENCCKINGFLKCHSILSIDCVVFNHAFQKYFVCWNLLKD